jgi:hypothetical protein
MMRTEITISRAAFLLVMVKLLMRVKIGVKKMLPTGLGNPASSLRGQ